MNTKPSGEGKAKPGTGAIQSQSSKSYLLSLALFETSFIANIVSVELGSHCMIFAVRKSGRIFWELSFWLSN